MTRKLCTLADLAATGAKEVILDDNGARISIFIIKHGDGVLGYVNSCPHARLPLNWQDEQFFDVTGLYLLCANHAAYFDIATGQCVRGPCKGQSLTTFPVDLDGVHVIALS